MYVFLCVHVYIHCDEAICDFIVEESVPLCVIILNCVCECACRNENAVGPTDCQSVSCGDKTTPNNFAANVEKRVGDPH